MLLRPEHARRIGVLLLLIVLLPGPATAADPGINLEPVPFRATYAASLNGMPLGVAVTLDLKNTGDDNWSLALAASSALLKYREESHFHWQQCTSTPQRYRYDFSGYGISRKLWLDFDHTTHKATGTSRKGPLDYTFPPDATDELSLSFVARCQFARGASETQFNVATTNGMRTFKYRLDGTETLKTPWGTIADTIRVQRVRKPGDKRRDTLWVAPSLGYIMVKLEHVEKVGVRGTVVLKQLEMAGKPVTAPPEPLKAGSP